MLESNQPISDSKSDVQPLYQSSFYIWQSQKDSNFQFSDPESDAITITLWDNLKVGCPAWDLTINQF